MVGVGGRGGRVAGCAANGKKCRSRGARTRAYRLERRRHALVELVHPERPSLLLGYVILEANPAAIGCARGWVSEGGRGAKRVHGGPARVGRPTNLILRDATRWRAPRRGCRSRSVSDAALPRVPHRSLHLLPGEVVHGGLARERCARWSGFVPFFGTKLPIPSVAHSIVCFDDGRPETAR